VIILNAFALLILFLVAPGRRNRSCALKNGKIILQSPKEGAQTTIALAVSNHLKTVTGKHFWDCRTFVQPPKTWKKTFCNEIWSKSEELTKLKPEEKLPVESF
jgi:hypothetical protein